MEFNKEKTDPWSPTNYKLHANFVPKLVQHDLLTLLSPKSHERILDLGCGDGVLTCQIQEMCKECVGIDKSQSMIEEARTNGCKDVRVIDCEKLIEWINQEGFIDYFDAVFSNAALHWMKNQEAVIEGIAKILKPGGRFVAELGSSGNVQIVEKSLIKALDIRGYNGKELSPWYFPSPEDYKQLLNKYKISVSFISNFPRPTELPTSLGGWVETFGFSFLAPLNDHEKEIVKSEIEGMCRDDAYNSETGKWTDDRVDLKGSTKLKL
ncbi:4678_t:CDS:2 [Funneliformis geosporum]|uniref:2089_t:CDS:1 n=1 Tax=Funneliformis geosporum TaxID=1117311 RepID=A0A9W4SWT8_9GLOM|nr:2089_t:CDS:2 [Funneliformis geosporum]CAI2183239.1 4678_t:CDS:2 [Funneliformis geosporum]